MIGLRCALSACVFVVVACAGAGGTTDPGTQQACTYTYSSWNACQSDGTQSRAVTVTAPAGCTGTPVLSETCTYSAPCTYSYSDWSTCQTDGTQTRAVNGFSPAGCSGTPVLSQACTYVPPVIPPPNCSYTYTDWLSCQPNGTQTRAVAAASPQGCAGTPAVSQICTYVPPPPTPGRAAVLRVVSGDAQNGIVGRELASPIVVQVTDAAGVAVPGQTVKFKVTQGAGSVFAGAAVSDANGRASERWTLGTTAGAQKLEASAVDSASGTAIVVTTITASAVSASPAFVTVKAGDGQTATQLTTLSTPLEVQVTDAYRNAVPGVQVTFVAAAGSGSASPASSLTDASGIASCAWTLGPTLGGQSLEALVAGIPAATFTATAKRVAQRIVFLGTSMTVTTPDPAIGWYGTWGMAASSQATDYVHVVGAALHATDVVPLNIGEWEQKFDSGYDYEPLRQYAGADVLVLRLGDNVWATYSAGFRPAIDRLLDTVPAKDVVVVSTWPTIPVFDPINADMKAAALARGFAWAEMPPHDGSYEGIAGHPNDRGMKLIADAILGALRARNWSVGP